MPVFNDHAAGHDHAYSWLTECLRSATRGRSMRSTRRSKAAIRIRVRSNRAALVISGWSDHAPAVDTVRSQIFVCGAGAMLGQALVVRLEPIESCVRRLQREAAGLRQEGEFSR